MRTKILQRVCLAGMLTTIISLTFTACKKTDEPGVFTPSRVFTPATITATGGETQASITWKASNFSTGRSITYTVEISASVDFSTPVLLTKVVADSTKLIVTDNDLAIKTPFYARVKGNATAASAASAGWAYTKDPFIITGEQLFLPVDPATVLATTAVLTWRASEGLTKITVRPTAGGTTLEFTLTPADIAARKKEITGLTAVTAYTAELYRGTANKGSITFTTNPQRPTGPNVTVVAPGTDLKALLEASVPGAVFILQQNGVYDISAEAVLPNNAAFTIWGDIGPNRPVLVANTIKLPATAGVIRFENLDITGYPANDPLQTKRAYVFNQSTATETAEISFENCTIRNLANTPLRLQGATVINITKVAVNNCIAYDISAGQTYAFINTNATAAKISNIIITNSTFYNIRVGLVLHNQLPGVSLNVSNCTMNDISDDTRALIDYNAQSAGTFTFLNNIIGKVKSAANTARGIRISGASVTVSSDNYITNDYTLSTNPIGGVSAYSGASTALFESPSTGNFRFKDAGFTGRATAGDPRWR
jgi:hypothetical protein